MFGHLISTLTFAVFALLSKLSATATGVSVTSVSLLKLSLQKRFGRAILLSDINRIGSIQSRSLELHDFKNTGRNFSAKRSQFLVKENRMATFQQRIYA
jgi:hypothetical protein